jgi:hypothetical protein
MIKRLIHLQIRLIVFMRILLFIDRVLDIRVSLLC